MSSPLIEISGSGPSSAARSPLSKRLLFTVLASLFCTTCCVWIGVAIWGALDDKGRQKFVYHPILMSVGVVGIPLAVILQQRLYGYTSKKIHMYGMMISLAISIAGIGIIITEKSEEQESHFETAHAIGGLAWCIFAILQSLFGAIALDPDLKIGMFRADKGIENIRRFVNAKYVHSIVGRTLVLIGYLVLFSGWLKFFREDTLKSALMGGSLIALSAGVLFDPISDYFAYSRTRTDPRDDGMSE